MICLTVCSILFVGFVIGCEGAYLLGRKTTRQEAREDCVRFVRYVHDVQVNGYRKASDRQRSEAATLYRTPALLGRYTENGGRT